VTTLVSSIRKHAGVQRATRNVLAIVFSVAGVIALAEGNACCGCNEAGCGNNWTCTYVILDEISGCCGTGSGNATCSGGTFCVKCDRGGSCGCDSEG
jgi:hypothetical protein